MSNGSSRKEERTRSTAVSLSVRDSDARNSSSATVSTAGLLEREELVSVEDETEEEEGEAQDSETDCGAAVSCLSGSGCAASVCDIAAPEAVRYATEALLPLDTAAMQ